MKARYYYKDGTITDEYIKRELHRVDGPAIDSTDGNNSWYLNGRLHRVDGPAVEGNQGRYWYMNGLRHRATGPAVESNDGHAEWHVNGKLHRVDGPAVIFSSREFGWFIDDKNYSEEEFNQLIKETRDLPLALRLIDPREWVRRMV